MNNKGKLFMAIAKGNISAEAPQFKRYIGVANCAVKGVNPNKKEMEELYNISLDKDPVYVSEVEVEGVKVPNARITFAVKPVLKDDSEDIPMQSHTLFIQKRYRYNRDKTKVQVIDKYGRTAWVTIDQCKNHEIPVYSNGPANLDKDYRPAYVGEEELTDFLIKYLNIPSPMKYNQEEKKWYMVNNPEDSVCRLDHIEDYFKGDVSEVISAINLQPANKVKILFGVKTGNEGKQFQTTFTQMVLKPSTSDYSKLDAFVQERKNAGAYSTTEFEATDIHEYTVKSTPLADNTVDPFATTSSGTNPWD